MKISIIIPTYNEADGILDTLSELQKRQSDSQFVSEIIVVDANSQDSTIQIVKNFGRNVRLICSEKSRPLQMNLGARHASSKILYFLHADCLPPQDYDEFIVEAVKNNHHAGCFKMSFDHDHPWMKFISWLTKFNFRACRGGDQSLFVTKSLFQKVGRYDENFKIFEDHELIGKLYASTAFAVIPKTLISSSRRFKEKGILRLQLLFWMIYFKKWLGASPDELFRFYKKYIS